MKKLLFLFGLLLPLLINAQQIDSFSVAGKPLKFSVPSDWVMEYKSDEFPDKSKWNLCLRHAVKEQCTNAFILVAFRMESIQKESQKRKLKKTEIDWTDSSYIYEFFISTQIKNKECNAYPEKIKSTIIVLNDSMYIEIILSMTQSKENEGIILKSLDEFYKRFKSENKNNIQSFTTQGCFMNPNTRKTISLNGKDFTYRKPSGWAAYNNSISDSVPSLIGVNMYLGNSVCSTILIGFEIADSIDLAPQKIDGQYYIIQNSEAVSYETDTTGGYINYYTSKLYFNEDCDQFVIRYYLDKTASGEKFIFTMNVKEHESSKKYLYERALIEYVRIFIDENQLRAKKK